MNKLRILTAVHGRPDVTRSFFWQLQDLREATGLPLPVTVAVSDDEDYELLTNPDEKLLTDNCNIVKTPNNPLTEKHNQALRAAMREKDWDLLLQLGSDDLCGENYIDFLTKLKIEKNTIYGLRKLYFYNLHTLSMRRFTYQGERLIGAGRAIPRQLLEQAKGVKLRFTRPYYGWKGGETQYYVGERAEIIMTRKAGEPVEKAKKLITLWSHKLNSGLDNESWKTLQALGAAQVCLDEKFDEPPIIDLKTRDSVTKWERIGGYSLPKDEITAVMSRIAPNITFE